MDVGEPAHRNQGSAQAGAARTGRVERVIPLGRAVALIEPIIEQLQSLDEIAWAEPAGSLRRAEDSVDNLLIVAACERPAGAIDELARMRGAARVIQHEPRRVSLIADREEVTVRFDPPSHAAAALLLLTGTDAHVAALHARAADRGWRLQIDGVRDADGHLREGRDEDEIYGALDLPFIPAEIRDGTDEFEAASNGTLPRLITRDDIRGDLHMHSTWSDGHDTIEAMVTASLELGYEYVAITDHSPRSGALHSLSEEDVADQAAEIDFLRGRYPDIAILHGCEVDILPDGSLDFDDDVLEQFDIVLASLHHRHDQTPRQLFNRYVAAMRHPLVTIITHPTNRTPPHKPGYDLDYDRLFEVAAETSTFLEVDGAPGHLDLDGALARRAIAAGASVTIDSDCHRPEGLARQMRLGVAMARRGWIEPHHTLNTRPLDAVRDAIARKRRA